MSRNKSRGLNEKSYHVLKGMPVQSCIIFKLDSILIDSQILNAINNALISNNYPMIRQEQVYDICNFVIPSHLIQNILSEIILKLSSVPATNILLQKIYKDYLQFLSSSKKTVDSFKQILEFLKQKGSKLALITGKTKQQLQRFELIELIDIVIENDNIDIVIENDKQNCIISQVEFILQSFKIKKSNCICIGDSLNDAFAAKTANIRFLAISHGNSKKQLFQNEIQVLENLEDIISHVQKFIQKIYIIEEYKKKFPMPCQTINNKVNSILEKNQQATKQKIKKIYNFQTQNGISIKDPKDQDQLNHLIYRSKQLFQKLGWRQIQTIVYKQFKQLKQGQSLIQRVKNKVELKGKYNIYPSLGQKLIYRQEDSSKIVIKFPTVSTYEKYKQNYQMYKKFLKFPKIYHFDRQNLSITSQFIQNIPHKTTQKQCKQFLSLATKISTLKPDQTKLIKLKFEDFIEQIKINFNYFNKFAGNQRIKQQYCQAFASQLKIIASKVDELKNCTTYRDLNLTNILRSIKNNQIFLVDFQNIAIGSYIIDVVYILSDKYYYFDDLTIKIGLRFYAKQNNLSFDDVERHFSFCSYYLTIRWLIRLTAIYFTGQASFHLNLRVLLVQLLRSMFRLSKYNDSEWLSKKKYIICKLIKGFLNGYNSIYKYQNLQSLPKRVILIYGPPGSGKNQIARFLNNHYQSQSYYLNIEQKIIQLRKKYINTYFKIDATHVDYLQIFEKEIFEKQLNEIRNPILINIQQCQLCLASYKQDINQKYFIICQVFLQIITKPNKIVILETSRKQILQYIGTILENWAILINTHISKQQYLKIVSQKNQKAFKQKDYLNVRNIQAYDIFMKSSNLNQINQSISKLNRIFYKTQLLEIKNYVDMLVQSQKYSAVIMAAGQGSRYGCKHKAFIQVKGKKLIQIWVQNLLNMKVSQIIIVDLEVRIQIVKQFIRSKFLQHIDKIQYVTQKSSVGPHETLSLGLQKVRNIKSIVISCDTYTNFPLSELYFDQHNQFGGKMLVLKYEKGQYQIKDSILTINTQENNPNKLTYGGIGCFLTTNFKHILKNSQKIGDAFKNLIQAGVLLGSNLDEQKYHMYNINTKEDHMQAQRSSQKIEENS